MDRRVFLQRGLGVSLLPVLGQNLHSGETKKNLHVPEPLQSTWNLPEVMKRENELRVGFYGIFSGGCRNASSIKKALSVLFPQGKIQFFWAQVRDLELAPYRFRGDILIQEPDLIVFDFPQGKNTQERTSCIQEALIRQAVQHVPDSGLLFMSDDGRQGRFPKRVPFTDNLEKATAFVPHQNMLSGTWYDDILTGISRPMYVTIGMPICSSRQAGARLSFRFKGTDVKIDDIPAPDGARLKITLDEKELFVNRYSTQPGSATFDIGVHLPEQEHKVSLEILPDNNNRTCFRLSRVLIAGELV